jgi:colanic acid/amylovoran biosynthesis glycosyltransferase
VSNPPCSSEPGCQGPAELDATPRIGAIEPTYLPDGSPGSHRHVAYIVTHFPKFGQTFIRDEIEALVRLGTPVTVASLNVPADTDLRTDADRAVSGRTLYLKVRTVRNIGALLRAVLRAPIGVARLLGRAVTMGGSDPDLIVRRIGQLVEGLIVWDRCHRAGIRHLHSHFAGAPSMVAMFARDFAALSRTGTWTWSVTIHGPHDFMEEERTGLRRVAAAADALVAITDYARSQLMRLSTPARWPRVRTIRCGIDLELFDERPPGPVGRPATLLTIGRLAPEKGQSVAIEATALLHQRGVPVTLRLVGDGPDRDLLVHEIADRDVADTVVVVGSLLPPQVAAELRAADVLCVSSFAEGLPMVIMEAMAVGVPVVAPRIAGISELVTDGETGWTYPAGRTDLLADAVQEALSSPYRDDVIKAARARVVALHDRRASAEALQALFDSTSPSDD